MRRVHLVVGPPLASPVVQRLLPTLWVSDHDPKVEQWVKPMQVHRYLGTERPSVVFDARFRVWLQAFGQIAPTVQGGGDFVLLMPSEKENQKLHLSHRRFVDTVHQVTKDWECTHADYLDIRPDIIASFLADGGHVAVLSHGRGRGKSAMLGMLARAYHAHQRDLNTPSVYLTSPHRTSADIALRWAHQREDEPSPSDSDVRWHSADDLLHSKIVDAHKRLLLIDEAAGLPVATLLGLLQKFPNVCAASTLHGYEGANMGFKHRALPFFSTVHWLKKPYRASEDALESLIHSVLHLDMGTSGSTILSSNSPRSTLVLDDVASVTHAALSLNSTADRSTSELNDVFALLNMAHYKTKPADFELLDKENVECWVSRTPAQEIVAACLVSVESEAGDDVWLNHRKVNMEHFLPHTLAQHAGYHLPTPALRILRIVVHPSMRRSRIASALIDAIENKFKGLGCRSLGCVFGATPELIAFWRTLHFLPVWMAATEDRATGTFAVTMVKNALLEWQRRFVHYVLPDWLLLHPQVSAELAARLLYAPSLASELQIPQHDAKVQDIHPLNTALLRHMQSSTAHTWLPTSRMSLSRASLCTSKSAHAPLGAEDDDRWSIASETSTIATSGDCQPANNGAFSTSWASAVDVPNNNTFPTSGTGGLPHQLPSFELLDAADVRDVFAFAHGDRRFDHVVGLRRFVLHILRHHPWETLPPHSEMMIHKVVLRRERSEQKWKMKKNILIEHLRAWTCAALQL